MPSRVQVSMSQRRLMPACAMSTLWLSDSKPTQTLQGQTVHLRRQLQHQLQHQHQLWRQHQHHLKCAIHSTGQESMMTRTRMTGTIQAACFMMVQSVVLEFLATALLLLRPNLQLLLCLS